MDSFKDNPITNVLGGGITEEQINNAVLKSGYPLQSRVALELRKEFSVYEEWSFLDEKTHELRTIDLLVQKQLSTYNEEGGVQCVLDLIIECKQSELPYIFFLATMSRTPGNFPYIAGLKNDWVDILDEFEERSVRRISMPVVDFLGLADDPFRLKEAYFCSAFSKCERRGKDLLLSGDETFNGIVYPVLKAMRHFKHVQQPRTKNKSQFANCHLVLGVAILDAPMIGVIVNKDSHNLASIPWVRVTRYQTDEEPISSDMHNVFALDIVHKDFLQQYISEHVVPFSMRFLSRVNRKQNALLNGQQETYSYKNIKSDEREK